MLANILRTDMSTDRPLAADSQFLRAIAVLIRGNRRPSVVRACAHHKLRLLLCEDYPALLDAFTDKRGGLLRTEHGGVLATAPPRAWPRQ